MGLIGIWCPPLGQLTLGARWGSYCTYMEVPLIALWIQERLSRKYHRCCVHSSTLFGELPFSACFPYNFADYRKIMFPQLSVEWNRHLCLCLGDIFGPKRLGSHSPQSEL